MVFGNCGVLQEMSADKGFVEMTGIDAETSQDIAEVYIDLPKKPYLCNR
jgi:3-hydroxyisobutyrate dehydrogenase